MTKEQTISNVKPHWFFWCVSALALFWNSFGGLDYYMTQTKNVAWMSSYSPALLEYVYNFPGWADAGWAIGVWGGVVGAVLMFFKSRFAFTLFVFSLVGLIVNTIYMYGLSNGLEVMGSGSVLFRGVIFVFAALLCLYARRMQLKGVLR